MSHFAQIDENNIVLQVLVIEQDQVDTGAFGDPARWIKTSYNTLAGVHSQGGTPFRKNYAGIGYTYDSVRDAFIPPQPFPSWVLNEAECQWYAPVTKPEAAPGEFWFWDENSQIWVKE